jgi:O-antigen/teichoic acid export membrane protein
MSSARPGRNLVGLLRAEVARNRAVLLNAGSVMSTTLVTAGLGAAFWLVAARQFSPDAVGVASAAVAAITLMGYLAMVGLGTLLMGELPRREGHRRGLINAALLVSGAIGFALGLGFALGAPLVSSDLTALDENLLAVGIFAVGVGLTAAMAVLDQSLIGLLRGGLQLTRNIVFSAVKLVILIVFGIVLTNPNGVWIYAAWIAGIAISLLVLARFYAKRGEEDLRPRLRMLVAMRRDAASHHIFNLSIRAPDLILPLIVVSLLSAEANANFYIAWMVGSFGFMVPVSLSSVLFAVGSGDPERLSDRYRLSVGISLALGLVAVAVVMVAGGPILSLFGPTYEEHALTTLEILTLGVFPETVKAHFLSITRVERRIAQTMPLVIGGTVLEICGAVAGALIAGLSGVAAGWLIAVCIEAVVMSRTVLRFLRLLAPRRLSLDPAR